jgi:DNA-binding MarR family transcriptional regulator
MAPAAREARDDPLGDIDKAIQTIGSLAARPGFHAQALARAGLTRDYFPDHPARSVDPALYGVLLALTGLGMPGPDGLAIRLGLHPSTVSHHLRRLEERGLVERRRYLIDRRLLAPRLTAQGEIALVTLQRARRQLLAAMLSDWAETEYHLLSDVLAKLADDIRVETFARLREVKAKRSDEEAVRNRSATKGPDWT